LAFLSGAVLAFMILGAVAGLRYAGQAWAGTGAFALILVAFGLIS
jgi:hypothetical protein